MVEIWPETPKSIFEEKKTWHTPTMHLPTKEKGGTRKIADAPIPCNHPGHKPPGMMVFEPGTYAHTCPGCGKVTRFSVPRISL